MRGEKSLYKPFFLPLTFARLARFSLSLRPHTQSKEWKKRERKMKEAASLSPHPSIPLRKLEVILLRLFLSALWICVCGGGFFSKARKLKMSVHKRTFHSPWVIPSILFLGLLYSTHLKYVSSPPCEFEWGSRLPVFLTMSIPTNITSVH